ncbi:MAG: 5'-nucleotidase C-terminal domain-containing protein, partial [Magnetovibrio sp.]|nr:5'-nucleotidase C-terminal domain-containing protein [Magnetovibrio sp.]
VQYTALADVKPDPMLASIIDGYMMRLSEIMDTQIGTTQTPLDTRKSTVRSQETAFGNLVADAFRITMKADVGMMNGGGIRGNRTYAAGEKITRRDIQGEFPFRNSVAVIDVNGADIWAAVENGLSRLEDLKGRFLHFSGMSVVYDPSAPVGGRAVSISVADEPLDLKHRYRLATVDFLSKGGDGFVMFKDAPRVSVSNNIFVWQMVHDYIKEKGRIAPKVEGRLVIGTR